MIRRFSLKALFLFLALGSIQPVFGGYVLIDGTLYHSDEIPSFSEEKHYELATNAFYSCDFEEAAKQFRILAINWPGCTYGQDAWFFAAVSYYETCDLDFSNCALTAYLRCQTAPRYFEEAVYYKLLIADRLAAGEMIHPIESTKLPKCIPAKGLAMEIYDEVISLMPTSELAAHAMFRKGCLEWSFGQYREAIATYQSLIRKFPKHELAPDAYLNMLRVYLAESRIEYQNPDILSFADITLRKFRQDFPKDERIDEGEVVVATIYEVFASGIYNIGEFYLRTKHPRAAVIYYQMVIAKFPTTKMAERAMCRLQNICPEGLETVIERCRARAATAEGTSLPEGNGEFFHFEDLAD
ncbi:outer membrane protein assembly factor BamD [Estrella lausannensis]|uniref:Outer membrane lipoprotein BamD-like domain-containing protein n=1 Tax=Estrella lausannensis TaxID=483423 RepID=A0A0H5DNK7_9BACT|nr:outer membrane protein assembly factor BamD [Estrella lausannensis]CRX37827.1 conserved hypothetical protein [Estrella lausannensis]